VRAAAETVNGALLVPQRAVSELQGTYQVAVVGDGNKVNLRSVKVGDRVGTMWIIHSSRRFVYWWNNFFNIISTVLVQALFLWKFDLSTMRNVLLLNIATAIVGLLITASCGVYGFKYGPQQMERTAA